MWIRFAVHGLYLACSGVRRLMVRLCVTLKTARRLVTQPGLPSNMGRNKLAQHSEAHLMAIIRTEIPHRVQKETTREWRRAFRIAQTVCAQKEVEAR
jgi:hypothetical protein